MSMDITPENLFGHAAVLSKKNDPDSGVAIMFRSDGRTKEFQLLKSGLDLADVIGHLEFVCRMLKRMEYQRPDEDDEPYHDPAIL